MKRWAFFIGRRALLKEGRAVLMEYWALSRQIVFLPVRLSFCLLPLPSLVFLNHSFCGRDSDSETCFFWF